MKTEAAMSTQGGEARRPMNVSAVRQQASELKQQNPALRARDIAQSLGISEGALVAAGEGTTRLVADFVAQFTALETLGPVMALTRNPHAVIERVGTYSHFEHFGHASQLIGHEIDLRL